MQVQGGGGEERSIRMPERKLWQSALDERGVKVARSDIRIGDECAQVLDVGANAEHGRGGQRAIEAIQRLSSIGAPRDDLCEHRVVVRRHDEPVGEGTVDAHAIARRLGQRDHLARAGQEAALRILRVHAGLDGVPGEPNVILCNRQRLPRRDAQLPGHEIDPGDEFGYRMLHLQPCVHLHEEELVRCIGGDEELDRARPDIVDTSRDSTCRLADACPRLGAEQCRGCLFYHLLVPTLQGTLPFTEVNDVAVGIREQLHLDVPRRGDQPLQQQGVVTERRGRDPAGGRQGLGELGHRQDGQHSLPTAACGWLHENREAEFDRCGLQLLLGQTGRRDTFDHRDAGLRHVLLRPDLVAHQAERGDARPDEGDSCDITRLREFGILGEEAVAGVDRLCAAGLRRLDDRLDLEVARLRCCRADAHGRVGIRHMLRAAVGVAVHGDAADSEFAQCADDAAGDLAAVGHEDCSEHRAGHWHHILNRPKAVSGSGVLEHTSRARPSTVRVSTGSMMPSSQSLAVE